MHNRISYAAPEKSPVPSLCTSSDAGSGSDLLGSMSEPMLSTFEGSISWHDSSASEGLSLVPRVVSTLLPSSESVASSSHKISDDTSNIDAEGFHHQQGNQPAMSVPNPKPAVTRRRQSAKAKTGEAAAGDPTIQRRQKRLERNRESARLSRRRRKQYLEVLEGRVTEYSHEMDKGRLEHVAKSVSTIKGKRKQLIESGVNNIPHKLRLLQTSLSRTSQEMMVASTFRSQQLKSFALPPSTKLIMWLTLQSDAYYRGGRAASERLSAARIGERVSCVWVHAANFCSIFQTKPNNLTASQLPLV
jgi:bZIP transcription factor